jgi:hypothetical protein
MYDGVHGTGGSYSVHESAGSVLQRLKRFPVCPPARDRSDLPPITPIPMRMVATEIEINVAPLGKARRRGEKC